MRHGTVAEDPLPPDHADNVANQRAWPTSGRVVRISRTYAGVPAPFRDDHTHLPSRGGLRVAVAAAGGANNTQDAFGGVDDSRGPTLATWQRSASHHSTDTSNTAH